MSEWEGAFGRDRDGGKLAKTSNRTIKLCRIFQCFAGSLSFRPETGLQLRLLL